MVFLVSFPKLPIQNEYEGLTSKLTSASPKVAKLMQQIISWCGDVSAWDSNFRESVIEFCSVANDLESVVSGDDSQGQFPYKFSKIDT